MTSSNAMDIPKGIVDEKIAEWQARVEERRAAEAADPTLLWRRCGREAARDAVFAERNVPAEGAEAFWEGFDAALPDLRQKDVLGRRRQRQ